MDHQLPVKNRELLHRALTHSSIAPPGENNERLEFVGDAVIDLALAAYLHNRFPLATEGELTTMRAYLANDVMLARTTEKLGLLDQARIASGVTGDGRSMESIGANLFEAVIGAIQIDENGGYEAAAKVVLNTLQEAIESMPPVDMLRSPKNLLQEIYQKAGKPQPKYVELSRAGPPHNPTFEVEVRVGDDVLGKGTGASKSKAEEMASRTALERHTRKP